MSGPRRERPDQFANMSAPPRSTLKVRPFRLAEAACPQDNWGLAWYARVDFDGALRRLWPAWAGALADPATAPRLRTHLRLCGAVALARGQGGQLVSPQSLQGELGETLGDELLQWAPALVLACHLPPLLVATPASEEARPGAADPLRSLAILTHLSGRTCDPMAAPLLGEALAQGQCLDLWTAEAAHG